MKLYYFPSPNPQKVRFGILELGIECEIVPVDLTKREQREPGFLALNPFGRVPVLTDGDLKLWESHAILSYLGDKTGKLWPTSAGGRADACGVGDCRGRRRQGGGAGGNGRRFRVGDVDAP